jgi:hypothetical protein
MMGALLLALLALAPLGAAAEQQQQPPSVALEHGVTNVPPKRIRGGLLGTTWNAAGPFRPLAAGSGSASDCEAACIAYRNTQVSNVSGWTRCQTFTWVPGGAAGNGTCTAVVDPTYWRPQPANGAATGRLSWPAQRCADTAGCSHNGRCNASQLCECSQGWRGDRCQTLHLLPTTRTAGLRAVDGGVNTSTWGGGVLLDNKTGLQHMWASEMLAHCGIQSWGTNSHIVHAVSKDGRTFRRTVRARGSNAAFRLRCKIFRENRIICHGRNTHICN